MKNVIKYFDHPFFVIIISVYPALFLLGHNISEVQASVVVRPLLLSLLFLLIFGGGAIIIFHDPIRSSLVTGIALILFFSYGQLFSAISSAYLGGIFGHQKFLILAEFFILFASIFLIQKAKNLGVVVQGINLISLILIAIPLFQIGNFLVLNYQAHHITPTQEVSDSAKPNSIQKSNLPDIYYIILDMYTRDDILKEYYGLDNKPFLNSLTKLGFYVANCSLSNYGQTQLSLASSLNMNYLPALGSFPADSIDRTPLDELIEHNAVRSYLEPLGYKTVSLSAYPPLKIDSAAVTFSTDPKSLPGNIYAPIINPFEAMFIKNSALLILTSLPQTKNISYIQDINYPFADHIRQQLYILQELNKIPEIAGPKFVFVHIQIPHPPMVFGPNGEMVVDPPPFPHNPAIPISDERDRQLYHDQVVFINKEILKNISSILKLSNIRPIIILQGDHGVRLDLRTPILNAYLLPAEQQQFLYPKISPVNTFRFILNHNFGTQFELLSDLSYNTTYAAPFAYQPEFDQREGCTSAK